MRFKSSRAMRAWLAVCSIVVVTSAVTACGRATHSSISSGAKAAPAHGAPRSVRVRETATPSPTAAPTPSPSPAAPVKIGTTNIQHRAVLMPPDAAPQIIAIAVSETTLHAGDRVSGSVVTSSNVASVQARIGGYAMRLNKVGVGRFALTYTVGPLPWFVRGKYAMQVIATNTKGDTAERTVPLTVR